MLSESALDRDCLKAFIEPSALAALQAVDAQTYRDVRVGNTIIDEQCLLQEQTRLMQQIEMLKAPAK